MKKLIIIMLICFSMVFSAVNTLKYNGKNDTWTGKWQMSATYDYNIKHDAFSGEETGYYVTKHNCEVTITVFAEENLKNIDETYFKMTFNDCPYMDSAVVSAYAGKTWIGDFHRSEAKETSYTFQSTKYFGIKMVKNITKLKFYPEVIPGERISYEKAGLYCNEEYEPSKDGWEKYYYCLNSDSIAKTKCLAKKNMVWIFGKCEKIKTCNASEDYLETTNICVQKEPECGPHQYLTSYHKCEERIKPNNSHWIDDSNWVCNDGYFQYDDECYANCAENEYFETSYHKCEEHIKPNNSHWIDDYNWVCNDGYYEYNYKCEKEPECGPHQYLTSFHKCEERIKPNNSHWIDDYNWVCNDGYFQYDDECYANCAENEYFETSYHGCRELPKKAIKNNTFSYSCPEGTHDEYDECVSNPIDWSFIKNVSHLYFDFDVGSNSCYSKYYDTEMCIGTSLTFGYNFAIGIIDNYFQIGLNLNSNLMINSWNTIDNEYIYDDGVTEEFYNALTIGSGIYIKLLNAISYTGYAMIPLLDTDFDNDYVNIKGLLGNKISIDGEHISIYFKYVYGSKFFNYKGVGFSYRF